jgi:hypothetical protein
VEDEEDLVSLGWVVGNGHRIAARVRRHIVDRWRRRRRQQRKQWKWKRRHQQLEQREQRLEQR